MGSIFLPRVKGLSHGIELWQYHATESFVSTEVLKYEVFEPAYTKSFSLSSNQSLNMYDDKRLQEDGR